MIKRFRHKLDERNWILDMQNLSDEGFFFNFVLSERGAIGKTFGAKEFILKKFIEEGHKSIWVVNTETILLKEKSRFIMNNKQVFPEKWKDVNMVGNKVYYKKECFLTLVALSTAEHNKGSRDNDIRYMVYDEFNVGLSKINKRQYDLLDNLCNTYSNVMEDTLKLQVFIFGNNKSMVVPIFHSLKIKTLKSELQQKLNNFGLKLYQIYVPIVNKKLAEIKYKNNALFQLGKIAGTTQHSFLNESLYDVDYGVVGRFKDIDNSDWIYMNTIFIENSYMELWKDTYGKFYFYSLRERQLEYGRNGDVIIVGKAKDLQAGYKYNPELKKVLIELSPTGRILYDTIITKSIVSSLY